MSEKLTCGDCKLLQDCGIRDMDHEACDHIMPWKKADKIEFINWLSSKRIKIPMDNDEIVNSVYSMFEDSL